MQEWLEKNYKVAVGGLIVVILVLAAAFASSRSTAGKEIAGLNKAKTSVEETVANRERELEETRNRVSELEKSVGRGKSEIASLTESNGKLNENIASLTDALASADKRIASLQDSVDIRRKAMANMRDDIDALKREARESLKEIESLKEENSAFKDAKTSLEHELGETRGRVGELEKSGEQAVSEIASLTESNGKLSENIASLTDALASADKRIASLQDSVGIRRKAMANMREDIAVLKQEARESFKEVESLKEENSALKEAKTSLEHELEETRGRVEELEKISSSGVEDALPASSRSLGAVMLKLSGLSPFGTIASELKEALPTLSGIAGDKEGFDAFASSLGAFEDFFGAVEDVAVLLEIDRQPELYVSFSADAAKLGEFMSRDSSLYSFDPWYPGFAEGGAGYRLHPVGDDTVDDILFYVLVRPAGASSLVFMATKENAISRMADAYDGVSPRFETERYTTGENFVQVKFKDGITYRDIGQSMWSVPALANLWNSTPDKVFWSVAEKSWTQEGDDLVSETYSDVFERNPEMLPFRPENAWKSVVYGDGSLAYYVSVDFGLLLNMLLPGATRLTPEILALVDTYATFPLISKEDFKDLLRGGRLSFICVEKDGRVSTAYAALETNVPNAAGTLYGLAGLGFLALPAGRINNISEWDAAMSAPLPMPQEWGSLPVPNLVIAERPGVFLVGLGNVEDFGKTLDIQAERLDYADTENVGEMFISRKIFDVAINYINYFADLKTSYMSPGDMKVKSLVTDGMAGIRDSFDFLSGVIDPSGRSYIKLALAEGKDPIKALFANVLLPCIEFEAMETNGTNTETTTNPTSAE